VCKDTTEAINREDVKSQAGQVMEPSQGNEKEVMVEFAEPENSRFIARSKFFENEELN
jgi:hypothetical protein